MSAKRPSPSPSKSAAGVAPVAQMPTSAVVGKRPHRRVDRDAPPAAFVARVAARALKGGTRL